MNQLMTVHDAVVDLLVDGLLGASIWQVVLVTLVFTHITIAAVTIFLHRAQAHRALELHAIPSHFFRLWLWLTTGMVTKEWVAIHRKHHAKCETVDDPHSPVTRGIKTVLLTGSELYRAEAKVQETLDKYGHNTPDDWIERNLYSRYSLAGRRRDAGHRPAAVRRHRRRGVGRADGLDPDHGRRHHQRHWATGGATATSRRRTRRPTSRRGASSSAAKSCTTTTTPTRPRPSCRSSPMNSTSAGSTSG